MRHLFALLALTACSGGEAETTAEVSSAPAPSVQVASSQAQPAPLQAAGPRIYDVRPLTMIPHDTRAFTQGLFVANGQLYESTGQVGESVIRRINLQDGASMAEVALPPTIFGEGATAVGDRIVSLSWRAGQGFVHDLQTLEAEGTFDIAGEGWGLAYDGDRDRLVLSDGTARLRFLDADTYEETGGMTVRLKGRDLPRLNELEYLPLNGGEIWANVWQQDFIVRIDAEDGDVTGVIDVSGLFPAADRVKPTDDVPNGVAYDAEADRLYLTGKRWPQIFEVELLERAP